MQIKRFEPEYLRQLVPIIDGHHQRLADLEERLPRGAKSVAVLQHLNQLLAWPAAVGCLAEESGKPQAFMVGAPITHEPDAWAANFFPPRYALLSYFASDAARTDKMLPALYAETAKALVAAGCAVHCTTLMAAETEVRDLWWQLGFGCVSDHAMAPLGELPIDVRAPTGVQHRVATIADVGRIRAMFKRWSQWHAQPPVFLPMRPAAMPAVYANLEREIEDPTYTHILAEKEGSIVGLCDGSWTARQAPLAATLGHTPYAHLRTLYVASKERGQGVGRMLCAAFYRWLRTQTPAPYVYLHYFTANPPSRSFWIAQGYQPLSHWAQRVIPGVG